MAIRLQHRLNVGVISDTHGLLRPEAVRALAGSDLILHAGDIGSAAVLSGLEAIAPVQAVRGNMDREAWSAQLPEARIVQAATRQVYLLHDLQALDLNPAIRGYAAVICGHTHRPAIRQTAGVLYFNPGAAGPRRGRLPATVGKLVISESEIHAEHSLLDTG